MDFKNVKKGITILSSIVLLGFGIVGCGGGSSTSTEATSFADIPEESERIAISETNSPEVTAAAVDAIGIGFGFQSAHALKQAGSTSDETILKIVEEAKFKKSLTIAANFKTLAASNSIQCTDGGSITVSGSETSGTATYNNCQESGGTINGTITVTGVSDGTSGTAKYTNFSISHNGEVLSFFESLTYSYRLDLNHQLTHFSIIMDGYASEFGERTDYKNYEFTMDFDANQNITFEINGFIKTQCLGAWIEIKTLETIHSNYAASCPDAGKLSIGGNNSSLTVIFNNDGSSDVSINGTANQHFNSCNDLDTGICSL